MNQLYHITGGQTLSGEISVKGAKNQVIKMMAAAVLADGEWRFENVPQIEDVSRMIELLKSIGVEVKQSESELTFKNSGSLNNKIDKLLAARLRASVMLAGPILAKTGEVFMPHPGGCQLGQRPIDIFIESFKALGAEVMDNEEGYNIKATKLRGAEIMLRRISHTVTEAIMMTATQAEGKTVIKNAAAEPEIKALADFLNSVGAKIEGAGTNTIVVEGVTPLGSGKASIIPDRIEAGTFVMMGLLTNSEIAVKNCDPSHLENLLLHLRMMGAEFEIGDDYIKTKKHNGLKGVPDTVTHEYPGLATDLQPPYTLLMTQASGFSMVRETIFDNRFTFTDLLKQMGANIIVCDPYRVVVQGPSKLKGRFLTSPDLRAGVTLVLAGLIAEGTTRIDNIYQIERGYENIVERLADLGANIKRVDSVD
jgi:UDP-N-acetylglucosamine 1-carboxyvinyltransferase